MQYSSSAPTRSAVGQAAGGPGGEPQHPAHREGSWNPEVPQSGRYAWVLLNEVWGYNAEVDTHPVETHIYRLRQKIEPDPANARLLVTEGGGYRLVPEGVRTSVAAARWVDCS